MKAEALDFPINENLLEEATQLKEEWRTLRERRAKVEENRANVSAVVYERVRRDYDERLEGARRTLLDKKTEIDRELTTLRTTHKRVSAQLEEQRHALEELKFRSSLGEFSEADFGNRSKDLEGKLAKFEKVLSAINANIERYASIFEEESELLHVAEEHEIEEEPGKKISSRKGIEDEEPLTDDAGYILEEEERPYFADTDATDARMEPSVTAKGKMPKTATRSQGAHLLAVTGAHTGTSYTLRDITTLGRSESSQVVVNDVKASRQHCRIERKGSEYVVVDLNSSNGTFVNHQQIQEHVLSEGDQIQIGDTTLQFQH